MLHLGTTQCCTHTFTAKDIQGRILTQKQALPTKERNLYGGNVSRFANTECPECGKKYLLWLKPEKNTYTVKTISQKDNPDDLPAPDDRDAIKAWLDARNIGYHKQTKTEHLYELVKQSQVAS